MPEINLLNNRVDTVSTTAWDKRGRLWTVLVAVILVVVSGLGVMLLVLNKDLETQAATLAQENQEIKQKLDSEQENLTGAKAFQAQLVNLKTLLDNHSYFTPVITELDKMTYIKAQYSSLDIDRRGAIHLEGQVSSYNDLSKLLLGLSTSPNLKNVKLLSILPGNIAKVDYFQFSISLNTVDSMFTKNNATK